MSQSYNFFAWPALHGWVLEVSNFNAYGPCVEEDEEIEPPQEDLAPEDDTRRGGYAGWEELSLEKLKLNFFNSSKFAKIKLGIYCICKTLGEDYFYCANLTHTEREKHIYHCMKQY